MTYHISTASMENHVRNIGRVTKQDLHLTRWSPGDGWTRYRIVEVENATGGERNVTPFYTRKEMCAFIDGLLTAYSSKFMEGVE